MKELSSDPPSCLVTYITRVDLKGKSAHFSILHMRFLFTRSGWERVAETEKEDGKNNSMGKTYTK